MKNVMTIRIIAGISVLMTSAYSETLVFYGAQSYAGTTGVGIGETGQVASATATASNTVAGSLFRGSSTPGFTATAGGSLYWSTSGTQSTESNSIADSDYFEFKVQASRGFYMNLSALSVKIGGSDNARGGTFNATVYVQINTGAGFYTVGSKTITILQGMANTNVAQDLLTVDLSGFEYERLSEISFRVGAYDTVNSSTRYVRAQDICLSGMVDTVPANQHCFVGAYPNGDNVGGCRVEDIDDFRSTSGKGLGIFMFYGNFGNGTTNQVGISSAAFNNAKAQNLVPFYKLSPIIFNSSNTVDEVATSRVYDDIKNGVYDDYLNYLAQKIAAYDFPTVILDFAHEMSGSWKVYHVTEFGTANGPENFIAAWRHLVDIFDSEGLGLTVMWSFAPDCCYNPASTSDYRHVGNYYPGNSYVDFVGCSAYAKGTTTNKTLPELLNTVWVDLMEACDDQKPFILSECAAVEEAGGSRPDWLRNNFTPEIFRQYKIALFNWFNQDGEVTSQALDDEPSKRAFREVMDNDFFMGEYCTLRSAARNEYLAYEPAGDDAITVPAESQTNEWRMIIARGFNGDTANFVYLMNRQNKQFLRGITTGSNWVDTIEFENWTSLWWDLAVGSNNLVHLYNNGAGKYLHDRSEDQQVDIISSNSPGSDLAWHVDPLSDLVDVVEGFEAYADTAGLKEYWYTTSEYEPVAFSLCTWARHEGTNALQIDYDFLNYPHRHTVRMDFSGDQDWSGRKHIELYYRNASSSNANCILTVSLQTEDWIGISSTNVPVRGETEWQRVLVPLENLPNAERVRRIAISLQEDVSGGSGQVLIDSIGLIDRTY